jgi:hypothetical protein
MLWVWLIVTACLLAFPLVLKGVLLYVVGPIVIHQRQTLAIKPRFQETRLEDLTPEMQDFLSEILGQFIAEGFEVGANVYHPNATNNTKSSQVLLVDRARGDMASLIMVASAPGIRSFTQVLRTRFADGRSIVSAASQSPRVFPPDPMQESRNFPWVKTPAALVEVHRRRVAASGRGGERPVVPARGLEVQYLRDEWDQEICRFVRCGYKWRDEPAGLCRFTWKGAILATWKMADPVKQILFYLRRRQGEREWKALGMDQWKPAPVAEPAPVEVQALPLPAPQSAVSEPLPLPQVATAVPTNGELAYEASLRTGELRTDWADGALTIRLGGFSPGQMLARRWTTILSIAFWCVLAALNGFFWWTFQRRLAMRGVASPLPRYPMFLLVIFFFLLMDVVRLLRAVRRARGTMMVVASRAGVRFRNAPAAVGEGEIPRSEVEVINVLPHEGIFQRQYRVEVRRRGAMRAQTILMGPDKKLLEEAARAMRQAMGIEARGEVAAPVTV